MTYEQALWSWQRHLAAGGSTPWQEWVARLPSVTEQVPASWSPPGAAQLELVRRVAARGELAGDAMRALADLVTGRSGPGRGLGQQPLAWPAVSPGGEAVHRTGAPAVDPAEVPAEELVRVGAGALTELLLEAPEPPVTVLPRRLWARPFRKRPAFALAGAPVTTSAVRRALGAAGHLEGGRSPRVLVVAEPLDLALAQVWSARVQQGAPVRWHGFVRRWSGRRELPPSVDVAAIARWWAERVGPAAVHLVVAPRDHASATATVADIIGVDRPPTGQPASAAAGPLALSPAALDVVRRVNAVLGVRVSPERHRAVLTRLVGLVADCDPASGSGAASLTVPASAREWARERAEQLARELTEELTRGGYPVHGLVAGVLPRTGALASRPRRADALEVVTACLVRAQPSAGPAAATAAEGAVRR